MIGRARWGGVGEAPATPDSPHCRSGEPAQQSRLAFRQLLSFVSFSLPTLIGGWLPFSFPRDGYRDWYLAAPTLFASQCKRRGE